MSRCMLTVVKHIGPIILGWYLYIHFRPVEYERAQKMGVCIAGAAADRSTTDSVWAGRGAASVAEQLDRICGRFVLADTGGLGAAATAAALSEWGAEVASEDAVFFLQVRAELISIPSMLSIVISSLVPSWRNIPCLAGVMLAVHAFVTELFSVEHSLSCMKP